MGALTDCSLGQRASCPLHWDNGRLARCTDRTRYSTWLFVYMIAISCLTISAEVQPSQQRHPAQFTPKTTPVQQVRAIPAGLLRMPPSEKQKMLQNSSRQNIENVRRQMLQQVNVVKGVARDLEQISESKLTGNGALRQKMIEAGVDRGEIERAMGEIKAAAPQMRETGKAMNESLDKAGAEK